ncbi:hypothetical protein LCGC14_2622590 [marine sediment metagenome]|uniref:Serine hydrolase family protein n=1 Tax=marine sediment metagenome TaxID=412755 RepID=A0A0F9A2S2_9ZZZZ
MKKKVIIVHGWGGYPEEGWFPWLKRELEKKGFTVTVPQMPNPEEPKIEAWVSHLAEVVGEPDEHTYFVGHSIGCQTILRYLETIDAKVGLPAQAGGAVLVAGFFDVLTGLEGEEERAIVKPWLETPIDFEKVKQAADNFVAIFSDDDPFVPLEKNRNIFEEKLGARVFVESNKGHFSGPTDKCTELPITLEAVLALED